MTKVVVWVKRLWDRYVIPSDTVVGAHSAALAKRPEMDPQKVN
jgi:hypothetical protein